MNGDVAAAGCDSPCSSSDVGTVGLCGWQLTLDALDSFQSLGHLPVQTRESESAASMCKVCPGFLSVLLSMIKRRKLYLHDIFLSIPVFKYHVLQIVIKNGYTRHRLYSIQGKKF